jgi:hypothetical protein
MAKNSNNVLAIGVGLNLDPLNNDIQQAASTAKSGMDTIGSAIVGSSSKSGTATKDLGDKVQSLRTQLRQATQDTQQMAEKFGVMSQQAIASAARAGELKDQIGDINTVITAFSADSKFTVVAGALQQAAGAASIVTGAMGLLGTESKATQEMLLKVQSALALTQGLAQLKEMGAAFTALQAVIVGQVIPSITAMGISMNMALGIFGLAAIGITALVVNYNSVSDATEKWRKELEQTIKTQALQLQLFKTWKDITTRGLDERAQALQAENAIYEKNKNDLIQQLVTVEREEIASGGRRSFARTIVNEAIKDNYRIHQEQLQKINEEYNKKELDKGQKQNQDKQKLADNLADYRLKLTKWETEENARIIALAEDKAKLAPKLAAMQKPMLPKLSGSSYDFGASKNVNLDLTFGINEANIQAAAERAKDLLKKLNDGIKSAIDSTLVQTFNSIGDLIGNAIVGNIDDPFAALGDILLGSLASLAQQLGAQYIAFGVAQLAFESSVGSLNPVGAIAAGVAMVAIGSVIKSLNQGGTKGASKGSTPSVAQSSFNQGNNMSSNFAPTQGNTIVINGMIKGNDIQLVNGRNDKKFNRNFNFG